MDPFHLHFFLIHIVIEFGFLWQRNRLLDFGAYRMRKKWYVNEIPRAILTFWVNLDGFFSVFDRICRRKKIWSDFINEFNI